MSKQKLSLQEQLLKSGLVSSAKAKNVKSDKYKQEHLKRNNNIDVVDEAKELVQKTLAEKVERDRELNLLIKQQEEQKHIQAQVKQLIELNKQPKDPDGLAYHFTDDNKVKTLYVSEAMRDAIINGRLAIVKLGNSYEVVGSEVAKKISLRIKANVIIHYEQSIETVENKEDPYARFEIPDDLVW